MRKLGLTRYAAWVVIGQPEDMPAKWAKSLALASTLEMLFNHGVGSVEQRLHAATWLMEHNQDLEGIGRGNKLPVDPVFIQEGDEGDEGRISEYIDNDGGQIEGSDEAGPEGED